MFQQSIRTSLSFRNSLSAGLALMVVLSTLLIIVWCDWEKALNHSQNGQLTERSNERPNIVLINLDDADFELLQPKLLEEYFPNINALRKNGIRFTNVHATTPLCAPSRASLMRGQYAFSIGLQCNMPDREGACGFPGGYGEFVKKGYHKDELGVWMRRGGYKTIHIGKYHHAGFDRKPPPGWEEFYLSCGGKYHAPHRLASVKNSRLKPVESGPQEYRTDLECEEAVRVISENSGPGRPFFLYVAPLAPHNPAYTLPLDDMVNKAKYATFADGIIQENTPDLFEADVSDKPKIAQRKIRNKWVKKRIENMYLCRIRAMKSIDEMVGRIRRQLAASELSENTYVMLTSDNGFQLGHHQLMFKRLPYNRCSRVPTFVEGPGVPQGVDANHLLAHIDFCPTVLELANVSIPMSVEAKSFAPLLKSPTSHDEDQWQTSIMLECWGKISHPNGAFDSIYTALRRPHDVFVSWANGEFEYYDLTKDPFQLENRYESIPPALRESLNEQLCSFRKVEQQRTTIATPSANALMGSNLALEGFAEDSRGIDYVAVQLRSLNTSEYWDGAEWVSAPFTLPALTLAQNQLVSKWEFQQSLGNGFLNPQIRQVQITPIAYDVNGNPAEAIQPMILDLAPALAQLDPTAPSEPRVAENKNDPDTVIRK